MYIWHSFRRVLKAPHEIAEGVHCLNVNALPYFLVKLSQGIAGRILLAGEMVGYVVAIGGGGNPDAIAKIRD